MKDHVSVNGHVAFFLPELRAGGAERVFLTLAKNFVAMGLHVDLVLARLEGELLTEVPPGVRLVPLSGQQSYGRTALAVTTLPRLIRYLRANRPDAMLSTMTGTNLLAVVAHRLARVPTRLVLREAATLENLRHPMYLPLMRFLYRRADAVVVLSQFMKNQLEKALRLPPDKVIHIPNPIDLERIRRDAAEPLPDDFDASRPYAVAVGRLAPQKDYMTLLDAFRVVVQTSPLRLVILGEGPDRAMLETRIRELELGDRVELRGYDPNPYRWMARADLFVLSSRWEGMPNTVLEARALGIPIVMTEYDISAREAGGMSAILVPVGDPETLARAIVQGLTVPRGTDAGTLPGWDSVTAYFKILFP
jgi:glycosyltransferase involved in cell wall biosynthesis